MINQASDFMATEGFRQNFQAHFNAAVQGNHWISPISLALLQTVDGYGARALREFRYLTPGGFEGNDSAHALFYVPDHRSIEDAEDEPKDAMFALSLGDMMVIRNDIGQVIIPRLETLKVTVNTRVATQFYSKLDNQLNAAITAVQHWEGNLTPSSAAPSHYEPHKKLA